MNGWASACVVVGLAALSGGCSLIAGPGMSSKHATLHPSATDDDNDLRLLEKPWGIAAQSEDVIVRVVGPSMTCTGTMIDEDLVLTAHHCLVQRGAHGEFEKNLVEPTGVRIELGGDYFAWGEVGVKHIVAPPCGEGGGGGDIAVLVLSRKLIGLEKMNPRLDGPPKTGEDAFTVGFGRCALSGDAIKRKDREGGPVQGLSSDTLQMKAAVCPGDSGGPVFSKRTHEIIGVVSLSAMDHDERTTGASIMARVDAFRPVFSNARAIADGTAPQELPPLECRR